MALIDETNAWPAPMEGSHDTALLQALMDDSGLLVIVVDRNSRIQHFNGECQRVTGFTANEVIGEPVETVLSNPEAPSGTPTNPPSGDSTEEHPGLLLTRSGAGRPVCWRYKALRDEAGSSHRSVIMGTCIDTGVQPAAEEGAFRDHQIAQTTIDNALDGIITVDDAGVIRSANPAAEQIFGYQAPEMYGHNISMLMPEPHVSHHDDYIRRYLETGERRIIGIGRELTGRHRDGSLIELHLAIAEGFAHGQRYFVGFTHDIGPRKRAEREARQHLAQLARTTRIYAMDALASSLAHEIRQPLTAVYTTAQACLILLDTDQQEPATLKESLRQITRQARRASEITDQLHHFVQQGETNELAEHDCLALIDDVLLLLAHKLHEAGVWPERHYNNLSQCGTKINRVLIEQVVFNLIDNAIDAMRETAPPRVVTAAACLSACGSWCEIEILDTGPGIPEEHLSKLFTPYFTTKPHGTGQGLALSKSIVEKHGGQLSARNPPAGGAAFRLTLPLDQKCRGHA